MDKVENTRSRVRCIHLRSMCRSFWPLSLKQTVILTAMSNYFLSYMQIIGPWPMTDSKRKPCLRGARVAQWIRSLDLTTHTSLSPMRRGFVPGFVIYKKGCTRLAAARDKVYQLLSHGRWFSPRYSGFLHP